MNTRSEPYPKWLHRFACFTAAATLGLIGLGGLVTSHGAGMAVPDWPTTYGYNMFLFPVSQWVGGIFYEHTHRLWASGVGLLTTILAVWIWISDSRRWMRWLGVAAFFAVALQGVLGGLRVALLKDQIGIIHASLAQFFLVLVCSVALFTSEPWLNRRWAMPGCKLSVPLSRPIWVICLLIFLQLMLGAGMRHQHAGLAVPDFPLAYGSLWPKTDSATIEHLNSARVDSRDFKPLTAGQIHLHMTHRIGACAILLGVAGFYFLKARRLATGFWAHRAAAVWLVLTLMQACLGAFTVWSNKAADVATGHVVLGAVSLVWGAMFALVSTQSFRMDPVSLPARPHESRWPQPESATTP